MTEETVSILKGKPTQPGFYWYITKRDRFIYEIFQSEYHKGKLLARPVGRIKSFPFQKWSGRWAGPLPTPDV